MRLTCTEVDSTSINALIMSFNILGNKEKEGEKAKNARLKIKFVLRFPRLRCKKKETEEMLGT